MLNAGSGFWEKGVLAAQGQCKVSTLTWLNYLASYAIFYFMLKVVQKKHWRAFMNSHQSRIQYIYFNGHILLFCPDLVLGHLI